MTVCGATMSSVTSKDVDVTLGGYSIAEHHIIRAWDGEESGCILVGGIGRTKEGRFIPHGGW